MGRWAWRRCKIVGGFWGVSLKNDQSESVLQPRGGTGAYLCRDWMKAGSREGAAARLGQRLCNFVLYTAVAAAVEAGWTAAYVPASEALACRGVPWVLGLVSPVPKVLSILRPLALVQLPTSASAERNGHNHEYLR